jgi:spore photoproduct lyase
LSLPTLVYQTETKGGVVRNCPGTQNHLCCGYKTIDLVEGCVMSCSYCILRGYLNRPGVRINTETDRIITEIDNVINGEACHILRFGTGELSDSLAVDRRARVNAPIVEYFGARRKALLELKSKWASIDHLRGSLNPYTIVSFSLAPQTSIDREEKRTSPLYKRLKALRKAQGWGCFVGIHFDPVIIYEGFEKDYAYLIDDIARILDLRKVIWASIGLLRFQPPMMKIFLEERRRHLLHGEFILGEDGKYRYIKQERIRVFRMLYELLKEKEPELFIYLCMERQDVWEQATGRNVKDSGNLTSFFDERIQQFYAGAI